MDYWTFQNLELPEGETGDAAVFKQDGTFVQAGHREECELKAIDIHGMYCWIVKGKMYARTDFEDTDNYVVRDAPENEDQT
tara:strand:- start:182 stop:424 length:243 start_codon:yes stop_codon:yes gene_type:complete